MADGTKIIRATRATVTSKTILFTKNPPFYLYAFLQSQHKTYYHDNLDTYE